jgi:hypothetical protein
MSLWFEFILVPSCARMYVRLYVCLYVVLVSHAVLKANLEIRKHTPAPVLQLTHSLRHANCSLHAILRSTT